MKSKDDKIARLVILGFAVLFLVSVVVFAVPVVDEFPSDGFACINQPCIMPQITIYQYLDREYINPTVVTKLTCNADNKTWYVALDLSESCGDKVVIDTIYCLEFHPYTGICLDTGF